MRRSPYSASRGRSTPSRSSTLSAHSGTHHWCAPATWPLADLFSVSQKPVAQHYRSVPSFLGNWFPVTVEILFSVPTYRPVRPECEVARGAQGCNRVGGHRCPGWLPSRRGRPPPP